MKVLILYALEDEVAGIHSAMRTNSLEVAEDEILKWGRIEHGELRGHSIYLVKCGAGKVLSSITAQLMIGHIAPEFVILCGVSGGINPGYERGDFVIGIDFIQHDLSTEFFGFLPGQVPFTDYRVIPASSEVRPLIEGLSLESAHVHLGRIASGDQFIFGQRGDEIRTQFEADVVDMESAAVAFTCHLNRVPFIVGRTISDKANDAAAQDFGEFLPRAASHVTKFVTHILAKL